MALNGYFYGTTANAWIKPKLTWSAEQSVEGNYSDITVTLSYSRTNTGYKTEGDWSGSITLGEETVTGKKHISVTYQSDTPAMTATFRVYHDRYGALSAPLSAEGRITNPADSTLRSTKISGQLQPDAIPRASSVSAAGAAIEGRSVVVIGRKSASFSHSLRYRFGQLEGWIDENGEAAEEESRYTAQVVNFMLPESFYGQLPDRQTGQCSLICSTYQGEVCIGQQETAFTVTADPALCGPVLTVTPKNPDTHLTQREDLFIRYLSAMECTIDALARKGATLVEVLAQGQPVAGQPFLLERVETDTVRFTVTDSRGYTAEVILQPQMIDYVLLTTNATVQRTDPTGGDGVLTLQGSCWKGSFPLMENGLTAAWTLDGQTYTAQPEIRDDHSYRLEIPLSGLDYRRSYAIELTVSDAAMTASQSLTVHKGLPVFDWGEGDFRFHVPVELPELTIGGIPLADYIRGIMKE